MHIPVLSLGVGTSLGHAKTGTVVSRPEVVSDTREFIADTLSDFKVPEVVCAAILGVLGAHARSIGVHVPEVADRALLRVLLAAARDSVVVPVVGARLVGAAVAQAS